jgi:hypothetical protein
MPPHVFPQEGSRRPKLRFCAADEVDDFALLAAYGLKDVLIAPLEARAEVLRRIA